MSTIKVFITGASGMLGGHIIDEFAKEFEILASFHNKPIEKKINSVKLDLTDFKKTETIINEFKPNFIIHAASISTPQLADSLPTKLVYQTNVNSTSNLAKISEKIGARIIYISTDLVYAGYRGSVLKEDSKLIPISLYAETKLMAEQKIIENSTNYTILRNALMYGIFAENTGNFFNNMYHNLKNNKSIRLFNDQFRSPIAFFDASILLKKLVTKVNQNNDLLLNQIVNFGGNERISRAKLGEILCEEAGFDKSLLNIISLSEFKDLPQVADVSLNIDKLISAGLRPQNIRESIKFLLSAL